MRIGVRATFVLDPESHDAAVWNLPTSNLKRTSLLELPNGRNIDTQLIGKNSIGANRAHATHVLCFIVKSGLCAACFGS
jgi:hypothetical protein